MSGKSQTIGDFTVSLLCQILPTNENSKSQISPIVWDGRGQIWRVETVSIFPTRPIFLRWSVIIPDKWKLKFVPTETSAVDFAHYQSPKLLGCSLPIIHLWFGGHFPFPAKFNIGRIWDRLLAIIRYIGKIWDVWQKVKSRVPKGGGGGSLEPWSPKISAVEPGASSFYWQTGALILFWLWSPGPKDILRGARSPAFSSLTIRVPRLHWFLITAFLCFFVRVNGRKETESEERTVHNTSISQFILI